MSLLHLKNVVYVLAMSYFCWSQKELNLNFAMRGCLTNDSFPHTYKKISFFLLCLPWPVQEMYGIGVCVFVCVHACACTCVCVCTFVCIYGSQQLLTRTGILRGYVCHSLQDTSKRTGHRLPILVSSAGLKINPKHS